MDPQTSNRGRVLRAVHRYSATLPRSEDTAATGTAQEAARRGFCRGDAARYGTIHAGSYPGDRGCTVSAAGAARLQQVAWTRSGSGGSSGSSTGRNTVQVPLSSLAFYRRYTELFLRRYMQVSMRMGKVPSVLGSCMFRGRVSSREMHSFEDAVIFVNDVERCLKQLCAEDMELIARIALQEYTQAEAADLTKQSLRTVVRKYGEAIDTLTGIFLDKDLLEVGPLFQGQ